MATEVLVPEPGTRTVVETTEVGDLPAATRIEPATHNYRAVQLVWNLAGIVITLIAIRFVLKLFGASIQAGFVTFIYGLTDVLVAPFRAIFPSASGAASTVETSSLVAIVVYALVAWGLYSVLKLITAPRGARSVS